MTRDFIDVVCGVAREEGKVLIAKRGKEPNYGKWEFPGGKAKYGESLQHAMTRELKEELSVKAEVKDKITENSLEIDGTHFRLHFFYIDIGQQQIQLNEHLDYQWVLIAELSKYDLCEGDKQVTKHLKKDLFI